MRINRTKKIFIFTAVCAILLPFLVLFAVPPAYAEPQPLSPEQQRLMKELQEAKKNEEVSGEAHTGYTKECGYFQFSCYLEKIVSGALNGIVDFILFLPLQISQYFLDWMLMTNLNGAAYRSGFVMIGWGISRDVANMFFIFFVLWMALATIFQFESYSAKRLLPKLIIVALLVNFSLPIGLFVVNVSNAVAKVFYDAAIQQDSLAQRIGEIAQITDTKQAAEFSVEHPPETVISDEDCDLQIMNSQTSGTQSDRTQIASAYNNCIKGKLAEKAKADGGLFTNILIAVFWKLIIGLVASFVFFAGAIFLLVRYLSLVILLIFGPLAFLFMILPATQEHWNKWWNKLTQWSFFAPVFMFMIMLSVRLSSTLLTFQTQAAENIVDKGDLPSLAMQYILVMGLFIASLFVAQSMGIAMSGTVVGWGRSMARGAGKYAKGASFRGMARAGGAYAQRALETPQARRMAATPLVRGLLRPLEAAIGAKRGVDEERAKQIAGAIRSGNPAYAAARLQGERASVQAAYLRSAGKDDIQKLEQGMGARAMGGIMDQLKSIAPELGKKIGQSFKDIDLRVAAEKGATMGTPEFERAREEYMRERSSYEMGQILTPENLGKDWVRTYLLKNAGEKEMNAIAQTGDQFRALALMLQQWANNRRADPASAVGVKINAVLQREAAAGVSPEEAMRVAVASNRTELAREMGGNQNFVTWLSAAPTGIMLQQGRFMGGRGENTEKLLAQLLGGQTQGGGGQPPGGTNP